MKKIKTNFLTFFYNRSFQGALYQLITLTLVVLSIFYIVSNTSRNLDERGMTYGWNFLSVGSQFDIQMTLIEYSPSSTYFDAFIVGLLNTLLVAAIGIFLQQLLAL